ncbi:MAG TPA: CcoQ/FixQ family Cbb3-type cytochrome c oxidase assembly chaperone [Verrucomicrobiota bacterium]|nr:CcoQ/FixQ family Cbb3-type cytochrome c oxidase assembly chaperone [Verrucomicrobiota bacterium]
MIKNVLEHIGGVGVYGVISICLFFIVFLGAIFFSLRMNKKDADTIGSLPLNDGTLEPQSDKSQHS